MITPTRPPKSVADGWTDGWNGPVTRPVFAKARQQMDGRSGPITRPAFAKVTQVIIDLDLLMSDVVINSLHAGLLRFSKKSLLFVFVTHSPPPFYLILPDNRNAFSKYNKIEY